MEKFDGTPGPWVVSETTETLKNGVILLQIDAPNASCENIIQVVHDDLFHQGKANANIVATAPELLDALQLILPHAELVINTNHPHHKLATAAINKALGK